MQAKGELADILQRKTHDLIPQKHKYMHQKGEMTGSLHPKVREVVLQNIHVFTKRVN